MRDRHEYMTCRSISSGREGGLCVRRSAVFVFTICYDYCVCCMMMMNCGDLFSPLQMKVLLYYYFPSLCYHYVQHEFICVISNVLFLIPLPVQSRAWLHTADSLGTLL